MRNSTALAHSGFKWNFSRSDLEFFRAENPDVGFVGDHGELHQALLFQALEENLRDTWGRDHFHLISRNGR